MESNSDIVSKKSSTNKKSLDNNAGDVELTVVMPCLNESETLEICIKKAKTFMERNNINGEIVIGDNGSTDGSQDIARKNGARVIDIPIRGYGAALQGGIRAAKGKYIMMGDSDDSYDFLNMEHYIEKLREGYDLVMGNRFKGGVEKGAMPFLHRYLGNPVLSFVGRLFFNTSIGDFHCGLRGFSKDAFHRMDLRTTGMEFASEMVVKASLNKMKVAEVATTLKPDGRSTAPHLNTWQDGWRHLRFLLMYAPRWLFLYPGLTLMIVGTIASIMLMIQPIQVFGVTFDALTLVYSSISVLIGFEFVFFFIFSKVFATSQNLLPSSERLEKFENWFTVEKGLITAVILLIAGIGLTIYNLSSWSSTGFGGMDTYAALRTVAPSVTLLAIGVQLILYSFFIGILRLKTNKHL